MKIFIIGGTGHIGSHLVPMLISQGHEVYLGTRGKHSLTDKAFEGAKHVPCDALSDESLLEIAENYTFDTIVDFPGTAFRAWNIFKDKVSHLVACGSLWMLGRPKIVPTPEITQAECFDSGYRKRYAAMQQMLAESGNCKAVFTAIMVPNISGPGKIPLDTVGGRDIEVHRAAMRGETVYLPEGPETLIAPCDAHDLAALFALAINQRIAAAGQIFNAGPAYALSATDLVKAFEKIYNTEIPIEYVPWEEYKTKINPPIGNWWHFYAHMCPDISKARKLLGYEPRYTPEQSLERAVEWMKEQNLL